MRMTISASHLHNLLIWLLERAADTSAAARWPVSMAACIHGLMAGCVASPAKKTVCPNGPANKSLHTTTVGHLFNNKSISKTREQHNEHVEMGLANTGTSLETLTWQKLAGERTSTHKLGACRMSDKEQGFQPQLAYSITTPWLRSSHPNPISTKGTAIS